MDSSQYLRSKLRNQQFYRSNWQARDASEVTSRHNQMAQANNSSTHHGPLTECCTGNVLRVPLPNPGRGFSTDYSASTVFQRKAGCAQCHDENFGKPGGVVVQDCCQGITIDPAIYGAYVTNAQYFQRSTVDSAGNTWLTVSQTDITLPIQIYNRYGTLVETIAPNSNYFIGAVIFISADGVSNIWSNRILYSNVTIVAADQSVPIFDSQGNFIFQIQLVGLASISQPTYFQIFDRNSQSYFQYSAAAGDLSREPILLKISPSGVWEGSSDPNTWVVRFLSGSTAFNDNNFIYVLKLDNNDNIIVNIIVTNTTGSTITLRCYDKTGTQFGTSVPVISGGVLRRSILVKIASDGGSTGSWNAYVYNTTAQLAYSIYSNDLQITSTNKIVFAFQYTGSGNEVRGSDDTIIGSVLPYSSFGPTNVYHTCIAVFGSDGTAANSFRVTIQPVSGEKQVTPIAVLVDSSDSIYCVGTAQQYLTSDVIRPYDSADVAVVGVDFTGGEGNMFFVKFSSTGVPTWISSLRGPASANSTYFGAADNTFEQRQYLNAYLDSQQNLVAQVIYIRGVASYYDTTGTLVRALTTAPSGSYEACIIKISPDGLTSYSARIGAVTGGSSANTLLYRISFDSSNNMNVLGTYNDNPCGFYSSTDDTTPLVQVSTAAAGTTNQFLAVYSPTLSTVQVGRVVLTTANASAIPYAVQQNGSNYILFGQNNGSISIFNFGNYTTTPNDSRALEGSWDVYLINFSLTASSFWTVTIGGAGTDYIGFLWLTNIPFYQLSKLNINGSIQFPFYASSMPNVYDRSGTLVSSMLNNQTASPNGFAVALSVPLDGYNLPPAIPVETVQKTSSSCYCADPGITQQPFPVDCSRVAPSYTGSANQVPIASNQQYGHLPKQQYPYPSG